MTRKRPGGRPHTRSEKQREGRSVDEEGAELGEEIFARGVADPEDKSGEEGAATPATEAMRSVGAFCGDTGCGSVKLMAVGLALGLKLL